jgi:hypothetical protein
MDQTPLENIMSAKNCLSSTAQAVQEAEARKLAQLQKKQHQAEQRAKRAESRAPKGLPVNSMGSHKVDRPDDEGPRGAQGEEDANESGAESKGSVTEKKPISKGKTCSMRREDLPVLAPRVPSGLTPG